MARRSFVVFSGARALQLDIGSTEVPNDAVALLADRRIPLVLCSGRTRAELEYLQQRIGISHPFICEHGAAVFIRNGYFPAHFLEAARASGQYSVLEFGRPYLEVVDAVHRAAIKARVAIVSFSEMSIDEVASACRVPPLKARLAKLRDYEEAFRVLDEDRAARTRLRRHLQSAQLSCVSEGDFDFAGPPVDLGVGSQRLMALYRRFQGPTVAIGIGDQLHHASFLRRVDMPIVVPTDASATSQLLTVVPRAILAATCDPTAVGASIAEILERQSRTAAS